MDQVIKIINNFKKIKLLTIHIIAAPWDWSTTLGITSPRVCKRRPKKSKCKHTKFGCCPDNKTAAGGPFEEGKYPNY